MNIVYFVINDDGIPEWDNPYFINDVQISSFKSAVPSSLGGLCESSKNEEDENLKMVYTWRDNTRYEKPTVKVDMPSRKIIPEFDVINVLGDYRVGYYETTFRKHAIYVTKFGKYYYLNTHGNKTYVNMRRIKFI